MKLSPRDVARYCAKPEPQRAGLLLFGTDPMRVALRRQEVVAALLGPRGEDEMRLTRLQAGELRKDPAALADAIRAQGFFPGPRVALLEDATDALGELVTDALANWQEGDAQLVVTAGNLKPRGRLRKVFEGHPNAYGAGIYDEPMGRAEIESVMKRARLGPVGREAMSDITALARVLDPGDFRQTVEKLALYKLSEDTEVSPADVEAIAPASIEAALDDVLMIAAEGQAGEIGPVLRRLEAQGVEPVRLCIGATRHFRILHAAASSPGGAAQGLSRARPPVHFKLRDRMVRQAERWGVHKLETALDLLVETDLTLRSAALAPQMAVMERTLIRLAMMGGR